MRGPLFGISEGLAIPFTPPAVQGLGQFGGFSFQVEDLGRNSLQELSNITNQLVGAGNQSKEVTGLFTSYTANDPQYLVNINREKAKSLQVPLSQITAALQVFMGSVYINYFDFNNRSYRVYLQADQKFRAEAKNMRSYYVKSERGKMIPLDDVVQIESTASPQVISHFNLFRSAEIDGSAAPGLSSGTGITAMEGLAKKVLPKGMTYEWSGLSLEEIQSSGKAVILFGTGNGVRVLTLAAQYESFVLPSIVLLGVPVALMGALAAVAMRGITNDVYCQIGLVMLIGLASKNADFDRGIRRTITGTRHQRAGRGRRSGAHPVAPDPDDVAGVHSGCDAFDDCDRRRGGGARVGRNNGGGWNDRRDHAEFGVYSRVVCDCPDNCATGRKAAYEEQAPA